MSFVGKLLVKNVITAAGVIMPPEPAVQIEGGSGISVAVSDNPTLGATVVLITSSAAPAGWVTVFDTDFSAQAAVSTLGNGTYNWLAANGTSHTWTKANSAADFAAAQLVNGSGIIWTPTGAGSSPPTGLIGGHTFSNISIALSSILPWLDPTTPLRAWLEIGAEGATVRTNEGVFIGFDDWNGSAYIWTWYAFRGDGGSGQGYYATLANTGSGATESYVADYPGGAGVIMLELPFGMAGRETRLFRYDSALGWPATSAMVPLVSENVGSAVFSGAVQSAYASAFAGARLTIGVPGDPGFSGADGYTLTVKRVRVDTHP